MLTIDEEHKISNEAVKLIYSDGSESIVEVLKINTRLDAIHMANKQTRALLALPNAFDNLHKFKNDFMGYRNYEIESYLDWVFSAPGKHKIVELCPFNGFSWFK